MNWTTTKKTVKKGVVGSFTIWIVGDDKSKFADLVTDFKSKNKIYATSNIVVESFSNYSDYYNTLLTSFVAGKSPDVFVLNNNESSIFLQQTDQINPTDIDPNNFRKWYQQFMWDDLIKTQSVSTKEGDKKIEYLIGVPVGYETLGLFYNRRYVQAKDVTSWAAINSAIKALKEKTPNMIPIALGNGSTVPYSEDILTQFFMLDDITSLDKADGNKMKQWISSYMVFGAQNGDNAYNKKLSELNTSGKTALDLFSTEDVAMVAGYPRMIGDISQKGFKKSFLWAAPFPNYFLSQGKTLVNYNYFVANKNSQALPLADTFLKYLASEQGQRKYLDLYPYYLPAQISLESEKLSEKLDPAYSIILKDFVRDDTVKSSFDKGIKALYDEQIVKVMDDSEWYIGGFEKFKTNLLCKVAKITLFQNLSSACK